MRLRRDSDELTPVVWFRAPAHAKWIGPTVFKSLNWGYPEGQPPTLGEVVGAPRPWYNGRSPGRYTGKGQCGPLEWFRDGIPHDAHAPPPPRHADGVPMCCESPQGGLFWFKEPVPRRPNGGIFFRGWGIFPRLGGGLEWWNYSPSSWIYGGIEWFDFGSDEAAIGGLEWFGIPSESWGFGGLYWFGGDED